MSRERRVEEKALMSRESEQISPDASLTSLSILNTDSVNVATEAKIPSVPATALNGSVIVETSLARLYRMRPNVAFLIPKTGYKNEG